MKRVKNNLRTINRETKNMRRTQLVKFMANLHKSDWTLFSLTELLDLLKKEVVELEKAISDGGSTSDIMLEAADVANFSTMIHSVAMNRGIKCKKTIKRIK